MVNTLYFIVKNIYDYKLFYKFRCNFRTLSWWCILARCWWTDSCLVNASRNTFQRTMFCAHNWAMLTSSVLSIILVTSLCFLSAISSSRCSQDGRRRARSARSASRFSRAKSKSLVTSRWTSLACWIRVADPTQRVVVSWKKTQSR